MKYADLHIHTTFSDGNLTPEQVVKQAKARGLSCIAITDHDTVGGIEPAKICARDFAVEVIAGVELTAETNDCEIHILGYFIDWHADWFRSKLKQICQLRQERALAIIQKLKEHGMPLDPDELLSLASETIGRLHIARMLKKHGFVYSIQDAFNRYIGDGKPCYVKKLNLTPTEAINTIRRLQGIAVAAHPYTIGNDELIPEFVQLGLRGIEVFYPEHNNAATEHYLKLAEKYRLLITGGSDFHGEVKDGLGLGEIKLSYDLVKALKREAEVARSGQE